MQFIVLVVLTFVALASAFAPSARFGRRSIGMDLDMKLTGRVKFFDVAKGFGFITASDGSGDIFVHQSAVYAEGFRSLAENEEVEFDIVDDQSRGKKYASNVTGPNGSFVQGAPRQTREPSGGYSDRY